MTVFELLVDTIHFVMEELSASEVRPEVNQRPVVQSTGGQVDLPLEGLRGGLTVEVDLSHWLEALVSVFMGVLVLPLVVTQHHAIHHHGHLLITKRCSIQVKALDLVGAHVVSRLLAQCSESLVADVLFHLDSRHHVIAFAVELGYGLVGLQVLLHGGVGAFRDGVAESLQDRVLLLVVGEGGDGGLDVLVKISLHSRMCFIIPTGVIYLYY